MHKSTEDLSELVSDALAIHLTEEEQKRVSILQERDDVTLLVYPTAEEFMNNCQLAWKLQHLFGLQVIIRISEKVRKQLNVSSDTLPPWVILNRNLREKLNKDLGKLYGRIDV